MAQTRLREYILPVLGHRRLDDVRRVHLEELALSLREKELSVYTQRHVLSDCRCLFSFAVQLDEIENNPFSGKKVFPKAPKRRPQPVPDADLKKILEVAPEPYRSAIDLASRTGMRWGEQKNLLWSHVESGDNPSLLLDDTKDGGWRRIPLDAESVAILKRWKVEMESAETPSVFVMPWRPISPRQPVRYTMSKLGIVWHWHQLRHYFACDYLRKGGRIEALSKHLGHASVKTTEIYAQLFEPSVRAEFYRINGGQVGTELAQAAS